MRAIRPVILLVVAILAMGAFVQAADGKSGEAVEDRSPLQFNSSTMHDRFAHAVDLWHDAKLKGNDNHVKKCSENILVLLDEDLKNNRAWMKVLVQQTALHAAAYDLEERNMLEETEWQEEQKANQELVKQMASLIKIKEQLQVAIQRTETFSNRYRLLGDYINLLRKDIGIPKAKLAYGMTQESGDKE